MANDLNRSIKIYLDNSAAMTSADQLKKKISELEGELLGLQTAGQGNSTQAKKIEKELTALTKKYDSYKIKVADTERVLKNLSGATYKELMEARKAVNNQLRTTERNTDLYNKRLEVQKAVSKELTYVQRELRTEIGCQATSWGRAADFINKYMGLIGSTLAGITGITMAFSKFRDERDKLEASSANLKALTGLDDENVKRLENAAKRLSTTVTKEGVRIKQSAVDIDDAFAIIGSQRPELLANAEALEQVTQNAIYLSIAGRDELEPAAKALTTVMNQMNLSADQSRRIINAIAAGSQAGAADIQYITDAFEKSGTTANLMNIQLEQHIGLIEAVAPKYSEAAVAGTSLDRVLLRMKEKNIGYKDGVFDLSRAIGELEARFKEGESSVSIFGEGHAKMAEILVMNKADIEHLTAAVTDTNIAVQQAQTNSDINEVKRAQVRNKINLLAMDLMEKLNPAINGVMDQTVKWTEKLVALVTWGGKNAGMFITLGIVLTAYTAIVKTLVYWEKIRNVGMLTSIKNGKAWTLVTTTLKGTQIALAAAQALLTGNLARVRAAWALLNSTMLLNPVVAIGVAIAALTIGIYRLATRTTEAKEAMNSFLESSIKEQIELDKLYGALKRSGEGTEQRTKLINEFNTKYGEYLPNLLSEKSTLEEIKTAYENATKAMRENLAQKTLDAKVEEIETDSLTKKTEELNDIRKKLSGLPESMIADAMSSIVSQVEEGKNQGLKLETVWRNVIENIRKDYFGNGSLPYQLGDELDDYVKEVYKAADKVKAVKKELSPFLPKEKEEPMELPEVVVTAKAKNKPSAPVSDEEQKKITDSKLKEVDRYVQQEKLKLKDSYLQNLMDKEEYNRKLEMLELEALNRRMEIYGLDKDKQAEIQDKILSYKVKILEQTKKFEKSQEKYKQKAEKKEEKAKKKALNDDLKRIVAKNNERQAKEYEEEQKHQEKLKELASGFSTEIGTILGGAIAGNNDLVKSSLVAIINMGLDALEITAQMAAAEAVIKGGGQGGLIGLAKGAIVAGLIKAAFSAVKALVGNMVNNIGQSDSASSVSSNVSSSNTGSRVVTDGFFIGGFTGHGSPYSVAGPTHFEEYVVPSFVMNEPAAMNHVGALEAMRRQKTNANPLPGTVNGFANGGYSGNPPTSNNDNDNSEILLSVMKRLIVLLGNLEGGIKAYVVYSDLERKRQTLEKTRRLGGK